MVLVFKVEIPGYAEGADFPHDEMISSILSSIREIGLKLTTVKGQIETIVIDHVDKPTPH